MKEEELGPSSHMEYVKAKTGADASREELIELALAMATECDALLARIEVMKQEHGLHIELMTEAMRKGMKTVMDVSIRAPAAKRASIAGKKSHEENQNIKASALQWYAENKGMFPNKKKAAEYIAKKVVPGTSESTVRDWLKGQ